MTTEEITAGNKLICKFLNWEFYEDDETVKCPNLYPIYHKEDERQSGWISESLDSLEFNSRWDWLMPVVEKIRDLTGEDMNTNLWSKICSSLEAVDFDWIYENVINYITWHNSQSNNREKIA